MLHSEVTLVRKMVNLFFEHQDRCHQKSNRGINDPTKGLITFKQFLFYFNCTDLLFQFHGILSIVVSLSTYSGFSQRHKNWQHWHYCQICISIYFQIPTLFTPPGVSKYELRCQCVQENCMSKFQSSLVLFISIEQYWHSCIVE